jgi:multiple sugar transport system substrate-binding protein
MGRRGLRLITLAAVPVLVLSACGGGGATQTATTGTSASATTGASNLTPSQSAAPAGKTKVVWFIGLGAGSQPVQLQAETDFVNKYNDSNTDNIFLQVSIIPNTNAIDVLKTQIAAGKGPDIVGPVGIQGRAGFPGVFLDLTAAAAAAKTDLTVYPEKLLNAMKMGKDGLIGLPYAIYPGFIFYNKDLFAAQSLPNLPVKVGDKYNGADWTWDALTKLAKQLTIDTAGKKSTEAGFNAAKIKQYGYDMQWVGDIRRFTSAFGAGNYVGADGKTAQIPDAWATAIKWYYDAMWTSHFAPNNAQRNASDMASGTTISTGRVAIDLIWTWAISSFGTVDAAGKSTSKYKAWDMAVIPSNGGVTTSPVDVDTFTIMKSSKVADAAYKAMIAMEADSGLAVAYGALPAITAQQDAYFKSAQAGVTAQFPGNTVTWSVATEMLKYAASPTHQDPFPNYVKGTTDDQAFYTKLQSTGGLNMDTELTKFKATLQADFDSAPAS